MHRYILPLFLLLIGGCSASKVETDYDPEFETAALRTFVIVHESTEGSDTLNEDRIRKAITREMQAKGYGTAAQGKADFHITFFAGIEEDVPSNVSFGIGIGTYSRGVGASVGKSANVTYDKGNLVINMIDPKTQKIFWRAAAAEKLRSFDSPEERTAYFNKSVASMLKGFPARSAGIKGE